MDPFFVFSITVLVKLKFIINVQMGNSGEIRLLLIYDIMGLGFHTCGHSHGAQSSLYVRLLNEEHPHFV